MPMSEKAFRALVQDRLIDTEQVRKMLGLETNQGVRHRVDHGWLAGPIIVRDANYALWDRLQVERQEVERLAKKESAP
jgi:hypothetical protein